MISVQNLGKQFSGERAIDAVSDLTFEIDRGSFLAIVGRSGSGKSTLLGMIGGISSPTSGSVNIDGASLWKMKADARADFRNRNIGFVFQFASLLPALRAIDNVALPALVSGLLDYRQAYARARALLTQVGLSERIDFYPGQLSGGEQRRVAIARALINEPELLVADEPTADLDEETENEILNLLLDIHRVLKLTLVVVTHNPSIASRADRVLEMRNGRAAAKEVGKPAMKDGFYPGGAGVPPAVMKDGCYPGGAGVPPAAMKDGCYPGDAGVPPAAMKDGCYPGGAGVPPASRGEKPFQRNEIPFSQEVINEAPPPVVPALVAASPVAPSLVAQTTPSPVEPSPVSPSPVVPTSEVPAYDNSEETTRVRTIFDITTQASAAESMRLGEGIERYIGRLVLVLIPIIAVIWGINTAVTMCQSNLLQAQTDQRLALENLAMKGLRADVKDVTFGPGNSYLLSLYLRNTTGDQPIYVMSPVVRAFIQVGSSWQEIPMKPANDTAEQVLKVVDEQVYKYVLHPDVTDYAQLLPYYMHIRFSNDMLVSPRSQPKDDLIDRSDNYYVYLKPHNADDSAILKKMKFPGSPPVWIPMPPH